MPAVETFQSWFLSSKCDPAGSVHLPTRKETFAFCRKYCWENTSEDYQFCDPSQFSERKLDNDKLHSKITALSYFTSPFPVFFFFPRFVLFALAGNKLQYDVCQTEKQRNSSLNKSEPLSSAGMLRSDPKLLLTRMVWFWPHPNFCPCKLSHRCHIKQLKWKTTPDVRLLLLHEIETALRFQENSTNSSPDMTPVGQTLPWPVATRTPCSRPRWPIWWEGVQPVPSHRCQGQQRCPSPWVKSPQPSALRAGQLTMFNSPLFHFSSKVCHISFFPHPLSPRDCSCVSLGCFLLLPRPQSTSLSPPQLLFVPLFSKVALQCTACRLTFAQHHC